MLRQLDDALWVADHPFKLMGLHVGTRTTLIRLDDGGLFVHSPGPLSVPLAKEIDALGPVRFIVAPNKFHHLYVAEMARAYQGAEIHLAPDLSRKDKSLPYTDELGEEAAEGWQGQIEQLLFLGVPAVNEVIFFHPESRTLLLTDLCFNFPGSSGRMTRIFLKLNSAYGRFTPSRMMRVMVRDGSAARRSVDRILAWDFDRVIVSHGEVLEQGGREALCRAFEWLGRDAGG